MFDKKPDNSQPEPTFISSIADIRRKRKNKQSGSDETQTQGNQKSLDQTPSEKQLPDEESHDPESGLSASLSEKKETLNISDTSKTQKHKPISESPLLKIFAKYKKVLFTILALSLTIIAVFIFKLDGYVFPASISGTVTDNNEKPLSYVKICVTQDNCSMTDFDGKYSLNNMIYGTHTLNLSAKNYISQDKTISINRNEKLQLNLTMIPVATGDVVIPLKTANSELLNLNDMVMYVDTQELPIELDSSYRIYIKDLGLNNYRFRLVSPYYIDIEQNITVKQGLNDLSPIVLQPAIDFQVNVIDMLSKSPVSKPIIKINDKKTVANAVGTLDIKDMPYTPSLSIKVSHSNYLPKEFNYNDVSAGILDIDIYEVTPSAKIIFQSNKAGQQNIYSIYIDSSEEQMISANIGDSFAPKYSRTFHAVNFLSTKENVRNAYGSTIAHAYTSPISNPKPAKISRTNYEDIGSIGTYNFHALKRAFSKTESYDQTSLYLGSIDGTNTEKLLTKKSGSIDSILIPNNGKFVVYSWQDKFVTDNNSAIYIYDLAEKKERALFKTFKTGAKLNTISSDQKYLLATITDPLTNHEDLYVINLLETANTRLTNSGELKSFGQFAGKNLYVYFITTEDNLSDIYRIRRDGSSKEKITNTGNVTSFIIGKNDLITFVSSDALFAIDPKHPEHVREITKPVSNYDY